MTYRPPLGKHHVTDLIASGTQEKAHKLVEMFWKKYLIIEILISVEARKLGTKPQVNWMLSWEGPVQKLVVTNSRFMSSPKC